MTRMRSIQDAFQMMKAEDPETRVTICMLRRLVAEGKVPSIKSGRKILLNYDTLLAYLSRPSDDLGSEEPETGAIRPVPVKL